MPNQNIRFADFATRAALFELQVEQDTTVGALKAMAEEHLSSGDDLCPMKYFDKWYLEVRVGDRKKLVGIDEGDEGLTLAAAGLEDESVVYLEGPMFEEGEAKIGRAIAAVRVQAKAQAAHHALQVQGLMAEMGRRFDAMAAKQQEQSEALDKALRRQASRIGNSAAQQSKAIAKKFDAMAAKQQEQSEVLDKALKQQSDAIDKKFEQELAGKQRTESMAKAQSDVSVKLEVMLRKNTDTLQKVYAEVKQMYRTDMYNEEVDSLLQKHSNRPLKALWEVLNDEANHGIELPMAIIMDRRCGIERRAELADGPMKSEGEQTINVRNLEDATPLIMAVHAGRNDVVSALLANGADYEAFFGAISFTALFKAAVDNIGAIELLASYGADVSKPTRNNFTPLHQAAFSGHAAAIEALVRLGADLTIVNSNGNTPLQNMESKTHAHLSDTEKDRLKALLAPEA